MMPTNDDTREVAELNIGGGDLMDSTTAAMLTVTAQQAVLPRQLVDGVLYAVLDADGAVEVVETPGYTRDVEDMRADRPRRVDRSVVVTDPASLLDYLHENTSVTTDGEMGGIYCHGAGSLEVWADLDQKRITALLDGYDGWRGHTATLQLKTSREWDEWRSIDGKLLDQERFAEFVEDHLSTIGEPDGAKLLEICQTMTGHEGIQWRSQKILANGARQLQWEERVEARAGDKGDLTIPAELKLVVRPFTGSAPVLMGARFRYRLRNGELLIGVKLAEPERALEDAFAVICADVQDSLPENVTIRNGRF